MQGPRGEIATAGVALAAALLAACAEAPGPEVRLGAPSPEKILIRDVGVLDVAAGLRRASQDVLLADGRIAAVGPAGSVSPGGARILGGDGATLVPGLIDMHGHLSANPAPTWEGGLPDPEGNLGKYLYSGVTTLFDPADGVGAVDRRQRVARGELLGPRVFTAGRALTAPEGHPIAMVRAFAPWWIEWYIAPRIAHAVATPEEARAAVDALAEEGVDAVKVIVDRIPDDAPRISNDVLAAVTERAHERGLRVVAHIGTTEDALDCARAGVDLFVHGVYRERIPDAGIAELARHGIPMVATFEVFERYARTGEGPRAATLLERETASAALLGSFHPVPDDFDPGVFGPFIELMRETREARLDNVRRLRAAGITILAGSDAQSGVFPGPGLHRELAWLVRSGMSPAEAIRGATLDAARFLANGAEPDFGQVAVGRRADLLLVDGNPARDVGALESIRTVFLGGIPLERAPVPGS